jgi:hypothetical protein
MNVNLLSATFWFWFIVINGALSALVAYVATQKRREPLPFFIISFVFSFLVGILVILALPEARDEDHSLGSSKKIRQTSTGEMEGKCPFCAEWVQIEAKICKHCSREIETELAELVKEQNAIDKKNLKLKLEHKLESEKLALERSEARLYARTEYLKSNKFKVHLIGVLVFTVAFAATPALLNSYSENLAEQEKLEESKAAETAIAKVKAAWSDRIESCDASEKVTYTTTGIILKDVTSADRDLDIQVACIRLQLTGFADMASSKSQEMTAIPENYIFDLTPSWDAKVLDSQILNSNQVVALTYFKAFRECNASMSVGAYYSTEFREKKSGEFVDLPVFEIVLGLGSDEEKFNYSYAQLECITENVFGKGSYKQIMDHPVRGGSSLLKTYGYRVADIAGYETRALIQKTKDNDPTNYSFVLTLRTYLG